MLGARSAARAPIRNATTSATTQPVRPLIVAKTFELTHPAGETWLAGQATCAPTRENSRIRISPARLGRT